MNRMQITNKEIISIVFCFDVKMFDPACVTIASLLDAKDEEDVFEIFCIVDLESMRHKSVIENIVRKRDHRSTVTFFTDTGVFDKAYETRGISKATYSRFLIHDILHGKSKAIYADVDVLFCGSIWDLWNTNIEGYYLAGVKGTNNFENKWERYKKYSYYPELESVKGQYINAGVLLMNLDQIRETGISAEWNKRANMEYEYQDQDIINITCAHKIKILPLRYNVAAYLTPRWYSKYSMQGLYPKDECKKAYRQPTIIHYAGGKPWTHRDTHRADTWWNYVQSQDDLRLLFGTKRKNYLNRLYLLIKNSK